MSTEISVSAMSAEQRELIRNTVAQGATDTELDWFLSYCAAKGFDPFAKEVWFIKTEGYTNKRGQFVEGRVQIMTSIDGFFRVANENPNYDGVEHAYGPDLKIAVGNGSILAPEWVEAIVHRKDRKLPERRRAYWREFAQELQSFSGKPTLWAQKPSLMLEKCADALALRKSFPQELGDLRTPEEMPREYSADEEERKTAQQVESEARANFIAQRTARIEQSNDYVIEFGASNRGSKVSEATNSIWLERHLAKYRSQIPEAGQKLIQTRIDELKREYARKQQESANEGYHPTPDEEQEILAAEFEEASK